MTRCSDKYKREELIKDLLWIGMYKAECLGIFRRMYSPKNLDASIDEVVTNIESKKLDWAIIQVHNTLIKFKLKEKEML